MSPLLDETSTGSPRIPSQLGTDRLDHPGVEGGGPRGQWAGALEHLRGAGSGGSGRNSEGAARRLPAAAAVNLGTDSPVRKASSSRNSGDPEQFQGRPLVAIWGQGGELRGQPFISSWPRVRGMGSEQAQNRGREHWPWSQAASPDGLTSSPGCLGQAIHLSVSLSFLIRLTRGFDDMNGSHR